MRSFYAVIRPCAPRRFSSQHGFSSSRHELSERVLTRNASGAAAALQQSEENLFRTPSSSRHPTASNDSFPRAATDIPSSSRQLYELHQPGVKARNRVPSTAEPSRQPSGKDNAVPFEDVEEKIHPNTYKAITKTPFKHTHMTPVQRAVLSLLPGIAEPYQPTKAASETEYRKAKQVRDFLVKARTGTGKTLAFLVPAIEARLKKIKAHAEQAVVDAGLTSDKHLELRAARAYVQKHAGALVISPTRELATQIANEALRLAEHHDGFEVRLFVGGMDKRAQLRGWMRGRRDIVVATPGRLRDLLSSEPAIVEGLERVPLLVLDEADTLLDMGFRDDIEDIIRYLPPVPERQTLLFSATVKREIQQIARLTLDKDHQFINCVKDDESPVHAYIPQFATTLSDSSQQLPHLARLIALDQLRNHGKSKILVFCPTTKMTELFAYIFREIGSSIFPSGRNTKIYEIHSKRSQVARTNTSDAFRNDKTGASVLFSSDVSARGVDYPGITNVIQIGIPAGADEYTHRVGRTGRAGTSGRCDLILLPFEAGFLTWQLTRMPIKPVTETEVVVQLKELAAQFDSEPHKFDPTPSHNPSLLTRRVDKNQPQKLEGPMLPRVVNDLESVIEDAVPNLDPLVLRETFASLVGYYFAKTPEMRIQKDTALAGMRSWAVDSMKMEKPPYLSEDFLNRLGYSDGRTKHFGSSYPRRNDRSDNRWGGRGQQKLKGRDSRPPAYSYTSRDGNEDRFQSKSRPLLRPLRREYQDSESTDRYSSSGGSSFKGKGERSGGYGGGYDGERRSSRSSFGRRTGFEAETGGRRSKPTRWED